MSEFHLYKQKNNNTYIIRNSLEWRNQNKRELEYLVSTSKVWKNRWVSQLQDLKVSQVKEPCIRINTRELNKKLCTELSTLYILDY